MSSEVTKDWFAVRCVFAKGWPPDQAPTLYEERITMWLASSAEQAIERAEAEAFEYAGTITDSPDSYIGLAQSYRLFDVPADGAEMFSLLRHSELDPEDYLHRFFDTGSECQESVEQERPPACGTNPRTPDA